jgi:hypothetical protein
MYAQPNEHGAYTPDQCEVITLTGSVNNVEVKVEIMLAHVGPDTWKASVIASLKHAGWGGYPAVDNGKVFPTRDAALAAACRSATNSCQRYLGKNDPERKYAQEAIGLIEKQKQIQMQMTLF